MGGSCHTKGKEKGAWFEIECVKNDIIAKEADGEDASFERKLLKSWAKFEGWELAQDELDSLGKRKSGRLKKK
jgi:hypothetical protein